MPKISKRTVDAAAPDPARRYYLWDSSLGGFGLLVLPTGIKSYVFRYRTREGRDRRATIGKHGALTPEKAREAAEAMAQTVRAGGDPLAEKTAARTAPTVGDVLDRYLESRRFQEKAETTRAIDRGRIERHLRPLLGRSIVDKLRPEDVRGTFAAIAAGKTAATVKTKARGLARVRGGEGTARDAIKLLRAALNWAVGEGLVGRNPCLGIKLGADGTRETILRGPDDYRRLFETLARMETERRLRAPVAAAIRVIALTGCRRGEIAGLLWSHVDLKAGRIVLPPTSHKAGRRTGKGRIIALPAAAQEIIARQPVGEPDAYVFQPAKGEGVVNLSHPWRKVRTEAKLPEGIGLHGLRHSLASALAMGGAQASEIQAALGHATITMAARYVHWADGARALLAERAAAPALAGMAAAAGKAAAGVEDLGDRKAGAARR